MQLDLVAEGITDVQIVGVSMIPFAEHDKSATLTGRVLPLVQDTPEVNAEGAWNALQRDVFILDDQGRLAVKLNLTTFDPDRSANNGENYELLKSLLLGARNRTDVSVSGNMLFQLFQDVAPRTTARFSELVNQGFYDGLMFHRVIDDFMAQGGDPAGNGTGGSGVEFDDEFDLRLTFTGFGQLAMANSGDDTNDSQFFITDLDLRATPFVEANLALPQHLNFDHTIFGQLIEGFDLFQEIMNTDVNGTRPVTPVVINNAMIVTDTQNALLRLSAPADFTGSSTITVTVTNPRSLTFERSFSVNVVADTVNDRPFLGPLSNIVTGVGTPAIFTVSATDLENDALTFVVRDPDNFSNPPPNVAVSIDQTTRQVTVTPGAGFTGLLNLLVGVRDDTRRVDSNGDGRIDASDALDARGNFDTQRVAFTVIQPVSNTRPSVAATSPQGTTIDKPLEFVVTASDPDADPATFAAEVVFERAGQSNAFQLQADDHMEGGITAQATLIEYLDFQ